MGLSNSILLRFKEQHKTLAFLLKDLSEEVLHKRPSRAKWSIHENLAHLGRYQENFEHRLDRTLDNSNPVFGRYKAEKDPGFPQWCSMTAEEVLQKLNQHRKELIKKLERLTDEQLKLTAVHPRLGQMDLTYWIEFFLLHETHHIYTIFWLSKAGTLP